MFLIRGWTWSIYFFGWTWLSLLIICSDGQDERVGTLLLSHDSGNVGLLGPPSSTATTTNSDLSETFNVNGNDILRIVKEHDANGENDDDDDEDDDDYFPKKLARQFRKHRWKLNGENSRALTTILQKTTTPSSSINVPITSNRTAKIIPQTHYEEEEEESEDAHNYGREEFDKIIIPSSPIDPVTGRNKTRTIHEDPHNDGYNDELHNLPLDIVKVKSSPSSTTTALTVEGKNLSRNRNESEDDSMKRMLNMKKVVDMELFKINNNDNNNFRFHADDSVVNNFDDTFNAAQLPRNNNNNSERIIAQLVNVTTEDVYISLESDEELGEDSFKNHKLSRVAAGGSNSNFGDKLGNMLVKPEASFEQGSIIKVNSSGIFPVSNLSSIWEGQSSRNKNSNNKKERNYSDKPTQSRINENSSEDFVDEEKDGEEMDEEDGKEGKTLMMRRRPRRSVVHLYDMVVCATGCNPLIYKGYGCFCGFMGSGITVDGIDKCCYKHDWCYHHAKCPPLLTYFVPYYWTCNAGRPKCVSDFRGWKGICGAHLCECDRQFAECLRKYPCPRSRAMCMTSPWRFWQNVVMPPPYY